MKKKLEADLISLAHKILQLKNKEDVAVLQQEALKLYEKLSVLRFVEEHFGSTEPTIGKVEEKLSEDKAASIEEKKPETPVTETPENESEEHEVASEAASELTENSEEVPAPKEIASVIEQLAASKSVADDESKLEEAESEEESSDEETSEEETSEETDESPVESSEDESSEETQKTETEVVESPTFEAAVNLEQPEAIAEAAVAQEETETPAETVWEQTPAESQTEEPVTLDFKPSFELDFEPKPVDTSKYDQPAPSFTFDDLLGKDYADPVFVTQEELDREASGKVEAENTAPTFPESTSAPAAEAKADDIWSRRPFETKPEFDKPIGSSTLNEKLSKGIIIGLNDRIAFMKNLFNNSSEDYNRVLSQLMTIDNYAEARRFIQEMVKPDYNNWQGKEEFEDRFMEIVEKRFL